MTETNTGSAPIGWRNAEQAEEAMSHLASSRPMLQLFDWFRANEARIFDLQKRLVEIPAPTFHEKKRSDWLRCELERLGWRVEQDEIGNLCATQDEPSESAPLIAMSAHLDTVFAEGSPIEIVQEGSVLRGPGVSDNGAGLAALWAMAAGLAATGLKTELPLLLVANVCEEGEGDLRGVRRVLEESRWRGRIAAWVAVDGSGMDSIICKGLGSRRFELRVSGPGGHSWIDFGAPNPIVALARCIEHLNNIELPISPRTALTVSVIEGGRSINAIPETASMKIDLRSTDERQLDRLESLLRTSAREAVTAAQTSEEPQKRLRFVVHPLGTRPAGVLRPGAPLLMAAQAASRLHGFEPTLERASTDANIPISMGLDALALGAGGSGGGAHTLHEWFDATGRDMGLRRVALTLIAMAGLAT